MAPIGLGTFQLTGNACIEAVFAAIKVGYRRIDTASSYKNEAEIARAIQKALDAKLITSRSELFITTKISPRQTGYSRASAAIDQSLANLKVDYLDLLLLHWPGSSKLSLDDVQNSHLRLASIQVMEEALRQGKTKSIGVSNFEIRHLNGLTAPISVNQFEMHPLQYHQKLELIKYCQSKNIVIEAYTLFGQGELLNGDFPELDEVAKGNNCTRAQALLGWALYKGFKAIPKASSKSRLIENLQAVNLRLSVADIELIDCIQKRVGTVKYCWDPTEVA